MPNQTPDLDITFSGDHDDTEPALTESEIAARIPVWTALAQLFGDNTMQPADYDTIAATLLAAHLNAPAARHILVHEVAPVFYEQLTATEDHWTGRTTQQVEQMVRDYLAKSPSRRRWLRVQAGRMSRRVMLGGWDAVEQRMIAKHQAT